jgi:DNA-binding LacI/PurR family transcriptional regulator
MSAHAESPSRQDSPSEELIATKPSLIRTTEQVIIRELMKGRWKTFLPGERTLSEMLQVSRSTLRIALQRLETEGYIHTEHGRRRRISLKVQKRPVESATRIVMLSPIPLEKIEPFVLLWLDHLRESLSKQKIILEIEVRSGCFSHAPSLALTRLTEEISDAIWLLFHSTREIQAWFAHRQLPHVVIGSVFEPGSSSLVDLDQQAVGRHAAGSFARLGHRNVAILLSKTEMAGKQACLRGFLQGKESSDNPLHIDVMEHDETPRGIIQAVDRILALRPRPTAIFSAGGMQTVTLMMRLAQKEIRSPDDMAIISRDDDPVLDFVIPSPARFHRRPIDFSRLVFRQIKRLLSFPGEKKCRALRIFPEFSPHATLGAPVRAQSKRG